jgi:hypothetical protein
LNGLCSSTVFGIGPINPTPVCIATGCTIPDPSSVTFCDGTAGTGSATPGSAPLGVCFATSGGTDICLPLCTFDDTGAAPVGCRGKDACNADSFVSGVDDAGAATALGIGFCFGGCTQDSDCPSGSACQTENAVCVKTKVTYGLPIGAACTTSQTDTAGGCNCETNATTNTGYCTVACTQGGPACPTGFVCDGFLPKSLEVDGGTAPGFTTEPAGLAGACLATCATPDASADAGGCPQNSTCNGGELAGVDCLP